MSEPKAPLEDIRFAPTPGLTYNPNEEKYWDKAALEPEILRAFELCHSCRMCFKYCQSFPTLFAAVDEHGDVRHIPDAKRRQVIDECFQCKLCYTQCPYTDAEKHPFRLDFPRLMMRAKAVRRRDEGIPLRDRLLADPDRLGALGCRTAGLANWGNRFKPNRILMDVVVGIHKDKLLPSFDSPNFATWFRRRTDGRDELTTGARPVVLFETCFVNYNRTAVGEAAVRVLERHDCRIARAPVVCCGMPSLDAGDVKGAQAKARRNVAALAPFVERGYTIVVINPTCSLMMRQEYPELLDDPRDRGLAAAARKVADATRDISEYLFSLRQEGAFREDFRTTPGGPVAYHAPCHLRMQNIGFRGRDLMRRIPGVEMRLVAECCGHDGTWAMKKEFFDLALKNGRKAFDGMQEASAELWTTDCPLAAIQFEQACGRKALHPIEVLDRAYREDGFTTPAPATK